MLKNSFRRSNKKQEQDKFYADGDRGGVNAWDQTMAVARIRKLRKRINNAFVVALPLRGENDVGRFKYFKELVMSADL